jgi:hypothetical protein
MPRPTGRWQKEEGEEQVEISCLPFKRSTLIDLCKVLGLSFKTTNRNIFVSSIGVCLFVCVVFVHYYLVSTGSSNILTYLVDMDNFVYGHLL